jgi:Glu-tRNA(Gln) amidotransferase subunit E-like FAD-binding protein
VPSAAALDVEKPWARVQRYRDAGLDRRAAERLVDAGWADLFDDLAPREPATVRRLAAALEKRLPRAGHGSIAAQRLRPLIAAVDARRVRVEALEWLLDRLLADPELDPERALEQHAPAAGGIAEVDEDIDALSLRRPMGIPDASALRWAMGSILSVYPRGRYDPVELRDRVIAKLDLTAVR